MAAVAEIEMVIAERRGAAPARIVSIHGTSAVTAAYDAVNAQTQFNSTTPQTLGYDPNGNLATTTEPAGATTYTWDSRDRLTGLSSSSLTATFQYDALDRRISKTLNGVTSSYQYDGADLLTETGSTQASYLSSLNIDEPIVRQTSSGNEFYLANDLGSTLALTDDSGAITTSYTYGPFGTTTVNGASTNPFQFTGRENDGNGLYYYRARYYNPGHGRFLAEDPLEFGGGDTNFYAYVFNNPVRLTDPTGEIVPLLLACGAGMLPGLPGDILGVLSGRKTLTDLAANAAIGCAGGAAGFGAVKGIAAARNFFHRMSQLNALNSSQTANLARFINKLPGNPGPVTIHNLPNGGKAFQSNVPATNIPGGYAKYEKQVDAAGNTLSYSKTVYDPAGNIVPGPSKTYFQR